MAIPPTARQARNVPERADTGTVDPTDYVPTPKEAPIPAVSSGLGASSVEADTDPEIAERVRAPRNRGKGAVETVKGAVSGVADKVRSVVPSSPAKPLHPVERLRAVKAHDERGMRAVERFSDTARGYIVSPAIRMALRSQGITGASRETVGAIVEEVCGEQKFAGFRVDENNTIAHRDLAMDELIAYTLGNQALAVEDKLVDFSINHPTAFDFLVFGGRVVDMTLSLADSDAVKAAIHAHIESQKPAPTDDVVSVDSDNVSSGDSE